MQRGEIFGLGRFGPAASVSFGLVDRDHVGKFEHALLDALQFVPGARQHEHEEEVGHVGDGRLRLANPNRLDKDHVEASGFAKQHCFARACGDAAERAARRARAG